MFIMSRLKLFLIKCLPFSLSSRLIERQLKTIEAAVDKKYYVEHYHAHMNGVKNHVVHYHLYGWRLGYNPSKEFDTFYYLTNNSDVSYSGVNPLLHFLKYGQKEGRSAVPVDVKDKLLSQDYSERKQAFDKDYLITRTSFDADYYLSKNIDVKLAKLDPFMHFLSSGYSEGRNPNKDFDITFYNWKNFDVIPKYQNPFAHYLEKGKALGLVSRQITRDKPHLQFNYSNSLYAALDAVPSVRTKTACDYALSVPFDFDLDIAKPSVIAVIAHVYYTELLVSMLGYIRNIPFKYKIFISTDTRQKKSEIEAILSAELVTDFEVRVFPNRGRDIAPFIVGFDDVLRKHEFFVHIHSKKSPHGGDPLASWGAYLMNNLMGSEDIVRSIMHLLSNPKIGIVFPQHFFPLRYYLNWGYNFDLAADLLARCGFQLDNNKLLEFPSGSMFWGRRDALLPLLNLKLTFDDFPEEAGQIDGTLAHAIERIILYICELADYRWAKIFNNSLEYVLPDCVLKPPNLAELSKNLNLVYRPVLLKQLSGLTSSEQTYPEVQSYIYYPSDNSRPRINLLVPSINPLHVFGGIATALRIFNELDDLYSSQCDFRIISTDAYVTIDARKNYEKYELNQLSAIDDGLQYEIITKCERQNNPLILRSSDIFIATAWWTAQLAFEAIDAQKILFKSNHKLVYLVQDYEPCFYGWSSKWVLAENTLRRGDDTIAIINSPQLVDFLSDKYKFHISYCLNYSPNTKIQFKGTETKEKIIIFYGRPVALRNLFEIIVDGISLWQKRNPVLAREWKIISVGEPYDEKTLLHVNNLSVLGKLSLEDYSTLLRKASIGLSLMLSPHPSYPPLEMAQAGLVTITNSCFGKDLTDVSDNIVSLDLVDENTICKAISDAMARIVSGDFIAPKPVYLGSSHSKAVINYDPKHLFQELGLS
jgi:O-antigen biosynthesis protein